MANFSRIIFVCTENTCLSIMAETVMNRVKRGRTLEVLSRGLIVLFPEPVNQKAVTILHNHYMEPSTEESHVLETRDLNETTLVLTMTVSEKRKVMESFPMANFVYTLKEFAGESGDVEEPGGELENYEACYRRILRLVTAVAEILFKEEKV
jgi:protein-tyrosine-phosphatase